MTFITGIIGIAMMVMFLGILLWWIREVPFTIIVLVVVALLVWDFVHELRAGETGDRR